MKLFGSWSIFGAMLAFGGLTGSCSAQTSDETRQSTLYLYSVEFPKQAVVCQSNVSGFLDRFSPAFDRWATRNKSDLAKGEAFLRSEATGANMSFEQNVDMLTANDAEILATASAARIASNCDWLLKTVELKTD